MHIEYKYLLFYPSFGEKKNKQVSHISMLNSKMEGVRLAMSFRLLNFKNLYFEIMKIGATFVLVQILVLSRSFSEVI